MKHPGCMMLHRYLRLLALSLLATGGLALLSGCKGNTTAAASLERKVPNPPAIVAFSVPGPVNVLTTDPLTAPLWTNAQWLPLTAPANSTRTTAPTRAALYFDTNTLYAAFVSEKHGGAIKHDQVSLYLDTSAAHNGTEMIRVSVDASSGASATWIRSAVPMEKREDAGPNLENPISTIPDVTIRGLTARVTDGTDHGVPVWTAVVAVPLKALPLPLRTTAEPGAKWRINLLRNVVSANEEGGTEQLQSNLSAVFVGAQDVTPYRLADLTLQ